MPRFHQGIERAPHTLHSMSWEAAAALGGARPWDFPRTGAFAARCLAAVQVPECRLCPAVSQDSCSTATCRLAQPRGGGGGFGGMETLFPLRF